MKTSIQIIQATLLLCILLILMAIFSKLCAQPYYNPGHDHIDYVVINKKIDTWVAPSLCVGAFTYMHYNGMNMTQSQRNSIAIPTWLIACGYALLNETEWLTKIKGNVRHKKHRR